MKSKRLLAFLLTICMIGGLIPAAFAAEGEAVTASVVYSFTTGAVKNGATDMNAVKSYDALNSEVSTGAWMYYNNINIDARAIADYGTTFREDTDKLNLNNAVILKAEVPATGTYTPSVIYNRYVQYGKLNVYFVPVSYADSKWTMSSASLNLAEVFADSGVKLVASPDGWVSSGNPTDVSTPFDNVYLEAGDYYVLLSLVQGAGVSNKWATYFVTKGITLTRQPGVTVTASKDRVKIGETAELTSVLKDGADNTVEDASFTYESLSPSVATVNNSGVVTGVAEGTATIQVTASFSGVDYTSTIEITVSNDAKYVFTSGVTGGQRTIEWIKYNTIETTASDEWCYVGKSNINSGKLDENGLQFNVLGSNSGNAGYVLKVKVANPGVYTPTVGWTNIVSPSIVDTYIVPAAYADAKWTMSAPSVADIIKDSGVKLVASADMSTGANKTGNPVKLSEDEYYVLIVTSGENGTTSEKAYGYIKSLELDWVSELSEDVENPYIALATANSTAPNTINVVGDQYTRGASVTVTAEKIPGYTFRHWVRGTAENGDWESADEVYNFTLASNTFLTAVYTPDVAEGGKIVEFFNGNGEYITEKTVADGSVELPSNPEMTGFKFLRWIVAKDTPFANSEITAPLTRVVAEFGDADETFSVNGTAGYKYDALVTETFSTPVVWYRDGIRVGYGKEYNYRVWDNVGKITKVAGTAQPLVVLDKAVKTDSTGTKAYMIEYDAGGKEIVEVGILFGSSSSVSVESCEYKATSKTNGGVNGHGQFTAKPANSTQTVARGYMIYQDGNEYKVVYSD